ncbi:MAG TPA: S8 family serine peptidase, partial [Bryobacteraceae bacterium]|nr:S8 family serine peptidase [Bryobacteraceae bacterium]
MTPREPQFKSYLISPPVRKEMDAQDPAKPEPIPVIVTLIESREHPDAGVGPSKAKVREFLESRQYAVRESDFYLFARLLPKDIEALAQMKEWVYQIWKDETCYAQLLHSTDTVKATAVWRTFEARGKGIVWGVMDTGVKADHPHFCNNTVDLQLSRNFSNTNSFDDRNGHGTHVAGIIAGCAQPLPDQVLYKAA